jgi:hypothetical protein
VQIPFPFLVFTGICLILALGTHPVPKVETCNSNNYNLMAVVAPKDYKATIITIIIIIILIII